MKGSNNPFPTVLLTERSVAPTGVELPPAGKRRLYVDDTGALKMVDSTGTVTDVGGGGGGGGLADAPSDGNTYARKDGGWIIVTGGGLGDAPSDGNPYGRKDAAWTKVAPFVPSPLSGAYISSGSFSGYTEAMAFDGNTATWWSGAGTTGQYIGIDLGSGHTATVIRVDIMPRADGSETPNGWSIDSSNDGTTWTPIATTPTGGYTLGVYRQITVVGAAPARYFRLAGASGTRGSITELRFWDEV